MVRYPSAREILVLHIKIINQYGGTHGLRDAGLLESAVARPRSGFGGYEAYPTIWLKAAALTHSLIKNHPFVDGNKRTGLMAGALFLKRNGYRLGASNKAAVEIAVDVAEDKITLEDLAEWLEANCKEK